MLLGGGASPCLFFAELVLGKRGGALLPSGLIAFSRGSGGIGGITRFVVALLVGLALRDDSSLEESSTGKALFFRLGLLRLDIVPTDDSSLEESSAGACTVFVVVVDVDAVVVVGGAKFVAAAEFVTAVDLVAAVDFVAVAEFVEAVKFVAATKFVAAAEFAEAAKFVAAACIDKEGNADVGDVFSHSPSCDNG
jgi:hypothetical protein